MEFIKLKSLRIFIYILLMVFFTDTVYASGMMVADQLCADHTVSAESHHHGSHDMDHSENHDQDYQKQSTNDQCNKCGHCMACFTVLPPSQIDNMQSQLQAIENSLFELSYHSYISAQPQRPPIS